MIFSSENHRIIGEWFTNSGMNPPMKFCECFTRLLAVGVKDHVAKEATNVSLYVLGMGRNQLAGPKWK